MYARWIAYALRLRGWRYAAARSEPNLYNDHPLLYVASIEQTVYCRVYGNLVVVPYHRRCTYVVLFIFCVRGYLDEDGWMVKDASKLYNRCLCITFLKNMYYDVVQNAHNMCINDIESICHDSWWIVSCKFYSQEYECEYAWTWS